MSKPKRKPKRKQPRNTIQRHHITYQPERIVSIYQTEHFWITALQRFKSLSENAKTSIRYILDTTPTRPLPELTEPALDKA